MDALRRYKCPDGPQAHADIDTPGVPLNTGSLGQTLSKSYGLAVGGKKPVFCLFGDGELQEGQCWGAFQTLAHLLTLNPEFCCTPPTGRLALVPQFFATTLTQSGWAEHERVFAGFRGGKGVVTG